MTATLHLDTNYLIFGGDPGHAAHRQMRRWLASGETLAVSAIAWAEFRCGPLTSELLNAWETLLSGRIVAVDQPIAERASDLFNLTGRRSRSLPDCLIAATAMSNNVRLATLNRSDFTVMTKFGLMLV